MRRNGNLWLTLTSFPHLFAAATRAFRGKRRRVDVAAFWLDLDAQLLRIQDELTDGSYHPGAYRSFRIYDPKERTISAAPFRDRVVHHALVGVLEPIYERVFIPDSYASRPGRGTHRAIARYQEFANRWPYVFKCDIAKYFPSIDHAILTQRLERKISDRFVLDLIDRILVSGPPPEEPAFCFPGDDVFCPSQRPRGLPLGNQTSQFLANVYLDPFDHFVKEVLLRPGYVRYVDDFVIFGESAADLGEVRHRCREFLDGLRLRMHERKNVISRVRDGTRFLGLQVWPDNTRLPRPWRVKVRHQMRRMAAAYRSRKIDWVAVVQKVAAWRGHAFWPGAQRWLQAALRGEGLPLRLISRALE